jgi:adenylylsulfate kinase
MLWIAMAGLPGTGKSAIAAKLTLALRAPLFDKDRVRAALFGPGHVDYSREQDDLVVAMLFDAVRFGAERRAWRAAILDGRTFSRAEQVRELERAAAAIGARLEIIECACSAEVALERIERDRASGAHAASNRDRELYFRVRAESQPIELPHLVVHTDREPVEVSVARCLAHLRDAAP